MVDAYHAENEVHSFNGDYMKIEQSQIQRELLGRFLPTIKRRNPIYVGHVITLGSEAFRLTGFSDLGDSYKFYTERVKLEENNNDQ